jgi:hypothetical protein
VERKRRREVKTHLARIVTEGVAIEMALLLTVPKSTITKAIMRRMRETGGSIIEIMTTMRSIIETAMVRNIEKGIIKRMRWRGLGWMTTARKARGSDIRRSIIIMITRRADPMRARGGLKFMGLRTIGTHLMTQIQPTHLILRPPKLKSQAIFRKSRRGTLTSTNQYFKRGNRGNNLRIPLLT